MRIFFILLLSLNLNSCVGVRLIQEYDSVSDNKINALQERTSKFFVKADRQFGLPEFSYQKQVDFYDDIQTDINVLLVRSRAIQKTRISQEQLSALLIQFKSLEELHKKGFKTREELYIIQSALENSFTAILQLQMSLKTRNTN
jgi:hypothetical protein